MLLLILMVMTGGEGLARTASDSLQRYQYRQIHMGMEVRIVLYAARDTTARQAASAAFHRIAALEAILSSYRDSSELNRLNEQAGGPPTHVSDALFTVLAQAQRLARQSDGAFDATVGPYIALWREARRTGQLPDSTALRRADAQVGWQKVQLNTKTQTVQLRAPGMALNLGGLAKGYILDRALATLEANGAMRAMIEAGGDLVVSRPPPEQDGWHVKIPGGTSSTPRTVTLAHAAISTSGDTEQFVKIGGTRYSHVIDPRTGLGLTHRLMVTIIADDGLTADGLATTVGILGSEQGQVFLAKHYPDITAYLRRAGKITAK